MERLKSSLWQKNRAGCRKHTRQVNYLRGGATHHIMEWGLEGSLLHNGWASSAAKEPQLRIMRCFMQKENKSHLFLKQKNKTKQKTLLWATVELSQLLGEKPRLLWHNFLRTFSSGQIALSATNWLSWYLVLIILPTSIQQWCNMQICNLGLYLQVAEKAGQILYMYPDRKKVMESMWFWHKYDAGVEGLRGTLKSCFLLSADWQQGPASCCSGVHEIIGLIMPSSGEKEERHVL